MLEAAGLPPAHHGVPDSKASAYGRDALLKSWSRSRDLGLCRRVAPTYEMTAYSPAGVGNVYWAPSLSVRAKVAARWPALLFELHEGGS